MAVCGAPSGKKPRSAILSPTFQAFYRCEACTLYTLFLAPPIKAALECSGVLTLPQAAPGSGQYNLTLASLHLSA